MLTCRTEPQRDPAPSERQRPSWGEGFIRLKAPSPNLSVLLGKKTLGIGLGGWRWAPGSQLLAWLTCPIAPALLQTTRSLPPQAPTCGFLAWPALRGAADHTGMALCACFLEFRVSPPVATPSLFFFASWCILEPQPPPSAFLCLGLPFQNSQKCGGINHLPPSSPY